MNIEQELARLEKYGTREHLAESVRRPILYAPEPFDHLIPSVVMGQDGPTLARLLLVSKNYLCDVHLQQNAGEFDFVAKHTIRNYRFALSQITLNPDTEKAVRYSIARIVLIHGTVGVNFQTHLEYVGDDRDDWIRTVIDAIPVTWVIGA